MNDNDCIYRDNAIPKTTSRNALESRFIIEKTVTFIGKKIGKICINNHDLFFNLHLVYELNDSAFVIATH